ncbi:MAG: hypothetical protein ACTSVI_14240 [Promethearchaeota archaeon]
MSSDEQKLTLECKECGAVFPISPEDIVVTCKYCGATYNILENDMPEHLMLPSIDVDKIKENFNKFLRKNRAEQGKIFEIRPIYLPYWAVPFSSYTKYFGVLYGTVTRYKTETYKDSEGNVRTRKVAYTVNVYRPEEGDFKRTGQKNVIARKHTAFYGFKKFQKTIALDQVEPFDFEKVKQHEAEFINAEVNAHEAQLEAYSIVENENRQIAAKKVNKLVRCDSEITLKKPLYIHAPLWQARYKFQGKVFKMAASGFTGTILKGEIPLTFARRLLNLILGICFIIGGGLLGQFLGIPALASNDDIAYLYFAIGMFIMLFSFIFTRTAFKMQLEKSEKVKIPNQKKKEKRRKK